MQFTKSSNLIFTVISSFSRRISDGGHVILAFQAFRILIRSLEGKVKHFRYYKLVTIQSFISTFVIIKQITSSDKGLSLTDNNTQSAKSQINYHLIPELSISLFSELSRDPFPSPPVLNFNIRSPLISSFYFSPSLLYC